MTSLETSPIPPMLLSFATALVCSLVLFPIIIKVAKRLQVFDLPDGSAPTDPRRTKVHKSPIPRLGGIGIVASFFLAQLFSAHQWELVPIFFGSAAMFAIGLWDDLRPLPARYRFLGQLIVAAAVVWTCRLSLDEFAISPTWTFQVPYWLGFLGSCFVIVGAINAFNMIDGLDGLAGGVVMIGVALLSYLYFLNTSNSWVLVVFTFPLAGALIGFLKFNTNPAKIFMGDGGSNWLGYICGILLILTSGNAPFADLASATVPRTTLFVPFVSCLLCLAVPVFDTANVIVQRLIAGRSPFKPDNSHLHHRLMALGLNQKQCVLTIYFLALLLGVIGILPVAFRRYNVTFLPYLAIACIPVGLFLLKVVSRKELVNHPAIGRWLGSASKPGPKLRLVLRHWESLNRYLVYGVIAVTPLFAGAAREEIGFFAGFAAIAVFLALFFSPSKSDFVQRLLLTIASCIILVAVNANYLIVEVQGQTYRIQQAYNYFFVFLGVSTTLHFIVTLRRRRLDVTPTDFLLLAVPLLLMSVPEPWHSEYRIGPISARALVLFVAFRTLMFRHRDVMRRIKIITFVSLVYITATSLWGFRIVYF